MLYHCITMSYNCQLKYIAIENKCTFVLSIGESPINKEKSADFTLNK